MQNEEFNSLLRTMILDLIQKGWQRTRICKLLMGEAAQVSRFLTPDENNLPRDFGIKPLQRIAQLLDYDVHVVLIDKREDSEKKEEITQLINAIENNNLEFLQELREKLEERLQDSVNTIKRNQSSNTSVDRLIESMLPD